LLFIGSSEELKLCTLATQAGSISL